MQTHTTSSSTSIPRTLEREVSAAWVAANLDRVRLIDVREPNELDGPLGAVAEAENVPLLKLLSQASRLEANAPLVLICRSGRRSGQAAQALEDAGLTDVASVEGGMLAWNTDVLGKTDILAHEKAANTTQLHDAIYRTNGLAEVSAQWVASHIGRFRLVDIREAHEVASGKVAQSEHIPMGTFMEGANDLDREQPLVVMCASGGRSGRVVRALEAAGFRNVASLEGGMYGWKAYGLPWA